MNKICTDIPQSEKLVEILHIESADMWFHPYSNDEYWYDVPNFGEAYLKFNQLPYWSLSALLNVLPSEIEIHKQTDGHKIYYYVESYMRRMGKDIYLSTERHENLVDSCYEMIIKLKKLDLL